YGHTGRHSLLVSSFALGTREKPATAALRAARGLLAQSQLVDQIAVAIGVLALQIIEQAAALAHHQQEAAARVVILGVGLEMFGQVGDPVSEQRHLNFRRTGVARMNAVGADEGLFGSGCGRHATGRCSCSSIPSALEAPILAQPPLPKLPAAAARRAPAPLASRAPAPPATMHGAPLSARPPAPDG